MRYAIRSFIVMILLTRYFLRHQDSPAVKAVFKGLRLAIVGLIASAALVLVNKENFTGWISGLIFAVSFLAVYRFKCNPIHLILLAGAAGWLVY